MTTIEGCVGLHFVFIHTPTKNLQNKNGLLFLLFEIILAFYRYTFWACQKILSSCF